MSGRDARRLAAAWLVAVALLVTGCAQMPTSGPVQSGKRGDGDVDSGQQPVQVFAQPPKKGWQPSQIVYGFLAAMASPEDDHDVARQYLTPDIRQSWPSATGSAPKVVVYAQDENFRLEPGRENTVNVSATQLGTISNRGEYRPAAVDTTAHVRFRMQRDGEGEWRIGSLPGYLLLNENDIASYEQFDLYFYAKDADTFVPDPIVLSSTDQKDWARELVEGLIKGPTPSTEPGVRSAIPAGTTLEASPAVDDEGTVTVDLGGAAKNVNGDARRKLVAQISATLLRSSGVSRVRVDIDGEQAVTQETDDFEQYEPTRAVKDVRGYYIRDSRLVGVDITSGDVEPLAGPFGTGALEFARPAVSLDAEKVAGVSTDDRELWTGPLDSRAKAIQLYGGTNLSSPSWDRNGDLWVVDNTSSGPRLLVFRKGGGKAVHVDAPDLAGLEVKSVRVSWDGVRVAFAATGGKSGEVLTGILDRNGDDVALRSMQPVAPTLKDVDDVWWYDRRSLAVAGREQSDLRASYEASIDGLALRKVSTVSDLNGMAAATGMPLLVSDQAGQISISRADKFLPDLLGTGSFPTYPG